MQRVAPHAPFPPAGVILFKRVSSSAIVNPKCPQAFCRPAHRAIKAKASVEHQVIDEAILILVPYGVSEPIVSRIVAAYRQRSELAAS